jgi:hypothetical protein
MKAPLRETDLYLPVKAFLEAQGYEVKAEIGACDLMARRGDEPPVIVELKTSFSLGLVLQGVARQAMFEHVYLAVPLKSSGWGPRYRDVLSLCRRLGLGLLAMRIGAGTTVEAHLDPGPYQPRRNVARAGRLLREFDRRVGDPNTGGSTRVKRMTAYRQDAIRLAQALAEGPQTPATLSKLLVLPRAGDMLRDDHYGWFERVERGLYGLTPQGRAALLAATPAAPSS